MSSILSMAVGKYVDDDYRFEQARLFPCFNIMNKFWRYLEALHAYYKTAKARHDLFDYLRAVLVMLVVMALIRAAAEFLK